MSQILELKNVAAQAAASLAAINPDHVAWSVGLQVASITKIHKVARGDLYRNTVRSLSPVYRSLKAKNKYSGLQAYALWYELGPKALKAIRDALATMNIQVQVPQVTE